MISQLERDNIILEAALEWGADAMYDIQPGTMGLTLYIDATCKEEASMIRAQIPGNFHGLYTIVRHPTHVLTYEDAEEERKKDPLYHT